MLLKIKNQQFLERPWLFTIYTAIGVAWPIYYGGPNTQKQGKTLEEIGTPGVVTDKAHSR
jgi:hypothetical protein